MAAMEEFHRWLDTLGSETYEDILHKCSITSARRSNLLDNGSFSDIILKCEGQTINCHRFVLLEHSTVFETMFQSNFKEGESEHPVEIGKIEYALLNKIVRFLYTGSIEIQPSEVMATLEFADMYEIDPLRNLCATFLYDSIIPDVAFMLWKFGIEYRAQALSRHAKSYCLHQFSEGRKPQIALTAGFLEGSIDHVVELLADPKLNIFNESEAFEAIIDWTMYDVSNRETMLDTALTKCIRMDKISPYTILDKMKSIGQDKLGMKMRMSMLHYMIELGSLNMKCVLPIRTCTNTIDSLVFSHNRTGKYFGHRRLASKVPALTICDMTTYAAKRQHSTHTLSLKNHCSLSVFTSQESVFFISGGKLYFKSANERELDEIEIKSDVQWEHLLFTSDSQLYNLTLNKSRNELSISQLNVRHTIDVKYEKTIPVPLSVLNISTIYQNRIFLFDITKQLVSIFDTKTMVSRTFQLDYPAQCTNDDKLVSFGSIACLLNKTGLCVVDMDELIRKVKNEQFEYYIEEIEDDDDELLSQPMTDEESENSDDNVTVASGSETSENNQIAQELALSAMENNGEDHSELFRVHNGPGEDVMSTTILGDQLYALVGVTHEKPKSPKVNVELRITDVNCLLSHDTTVLDWQTGSMQVDIPCLTQLEANTLELSGWRLSTLQIKNPEKSNLSSI